MAHRMSEEAVNRRIVSDLSTLEKARWADPTDNDRVHPAIPTGHVGDVKTILSWLRGNEMSMIADFFVASMKKGPAAFRREFYIDDRVYGMPVQTAFSNGRVGKREVNKALARLFGAQEKLDFTRHPGKKMARSNPKGPKGKTMAKRRKNPTHRVESTKAGRRLRPSAGTVKQASKLLTARKRAIAAGETPPTRLGHFDYRAAEWKLQQGKKAAARKRAASKASKPRAARTRAAKPAKGRFDTLGSRLRKTGSLVDWFY